MSDENSDFNPVVNQMAQAVTNAWSVLKDRLDKDVYPSDETSDENIKIALAVVHEYRLMLLLSMLAGVKDQYMSTLLGIVKKEK